jgi:hypothetical protein
MTKTYTQAPTTPEQEQLFEAGYRVMRDENRTFFATAPDGIQIYSGSNLGYAWTLCENHHSFSNQPPRPHIVCLCGSTRFSEAYQKANLLETLAGNIVLTIGADMKSDNELFASMSADELQSVKQRLDDLHLQKIRLADSILVLNVDGYIGDSTRREIEFAAKAGKLIRYWESDNASI